MGFVGLRVFARSSHCDLRLTGTTSSESDGGGDRQTFPECEAVLASLDPGPEVRFTSPSPVPISKSYVSFTSNNAFTGLSVLRRVSRPCVDTYPDEWVAPWYYRQTTGRPRPRRPLACLCRGEAPSVSVVGVRGGGAPDTQEGPPVRHQVDHDRGRPRGTDRVLKDRPLCTGTASRTQSGTQSRDYETWVTRGSTPPEVTEDCLQECRLRCCNLLSPRNVRSSSTSIDAVVWELVLFFHTPRTVPTLPLTSLRPSRHV